MELEIEYDDHTLLIAKFQDEGSVYDTEFSYRIVPKAFLKDLRVVVWVGDIDYDLTAGFPEKTLKHFEEVAWDKYNELNSDAI